MANRKQKAAATTNSCGDDNNKKGTVKTKGKQKSVPKKCPQQRSSIYRGVTRHRLTGRYEAHLWDKNCWNESQSKKGRQVYLGAYDDEATAAHAYDMAAVKYWGHDTILNFPLTTYKEELKEMEGQTREEYIGSLRRKSSGFSRGVSKYRGVARHHHNGKWEARIGKVFGNKYLYLGTYATEEEAATAYDMAAINYRGLNAITNFELNRYIKRIRPLQNTVNNPQKTSNGSIDDKTMKNSNEEIKSNFVKFKQEIPIPNDQAIVLLPHLVGKTSSTLAFRPLLQSSKFKEISEQTTVYRTSSSSTSKPDPPRSYFPDDIQTLFDIQDASNYAEEHDMIFGNYNLLVSPIFQCEFDTTSVEEHKQNVELQII